MQRKTTGIKNTLVILVWNEIGSIRKLFEQIPLDSVDEAIVIDPGSDDGTVEFLSGRGLPVYFQERSGRGNAFMEGLRRAKGENIIFFSGDGNEDPKDIPKIVRYLEMGNDLVIAGRNIFRDSETDDSDDPIRIRKFFNIACSLLVRIIWKSGVRDAINGFRGMKRDAMERMCLDAPKHEIEFQSTIRASKLGMKIKEFPTKELCRMGGPRKPTAGTLQLACSFLRFFAKELIKGREFAAGNRQKCAK